MNAYETWESMTAAERAAVADSEFAGVVRAALMEAGLLVAGDDDEDLAEPQAPVVPGDEVWTIAEVASYGDPNPLFSFASCEAATAALGILQDAGKVREDWDTGSKYCEPARLVVLPARLSTLAQLNSVRAQVAAARSLSEARRKAVEARKARQADAAKITQRLLQERGQAQLRAARLDEIRRTYREYQEIAGDNGKASLFLARAYPVADINEALGGEVAQ